MKGVNDRFRLRHEVIDGKHTLEVIPSPVVKGFKPKTIEISSEQWDALQYHFGKKENNYEAYLVTFS